MKFKTKCFRMKFKTKCFRMKFIPTSQVFLLALLVPSAFASVRQKMFEKVIDSKSNGVPLESLAINDPAMCQVKIKKNVSDFLWKTKTDFLIGLLKLQFNNGFTSSNCILLVIDQNLFTESYIYLYHIFTKQKRNFFMKILIFTNASTYLNMSCWAMLNFSG